jgi:hypothetical protein
LINESTAQNFQSRYLLGERGALSGLYAECRSITESLAKAYISRHECNDTNMDDTVQIILSRVLARYRNPGYRIFSFAKVLNIEIVHELSNHKGPKAQFARSIVPLEVEVIAPCEGPEKLDRRPQYLFEILTIPAGRSIVYELRRARTYRAAIRRIDSMASRRWIYDHGVQLLYVFKALKRGKESRNDKH